MKKCAPKARPENFGVFGSGQIQISWLGSLNKGGVFDKGGGFDGN